MAFKMIDKRVNVAKRLKDYKDILEVFEKEVEDKAYRIATGLENVPYYEGKAENIAYYEGKAAAYRIALTFFKEYLEKIVIKKERRKK